MSIHCFKSLMVSIITLYHKVTEQSEEADTASRGRHIISKHYLLCGEKNQATLNLSKLVS